MACVLSACGAGEEEGVMFLLMVRCGELLVVLCMGGVQRFVTAAAVVPDDRGIEGVLVVCLSGDGWFDLDETFELLEFENLLVKVLVLGIVPFDLFITRMVRRAGVII